VVGWDAVTEFRSARRWEWSCPRLSNGFGGWKNNWPCWAATLTWPPPLGTIPPGIPPGAPAFPGHLGLSPR
jgi:hypothetical protein